MNLYTTVVVLIPAPSQAEPALSSPVSPVLVNVMARDPQHARLRVENCGVFPEGMTFAILAIIPDHVVSLWPPKTPHIKL